MLVTDTRYWAGHDTQEWGRLRLERHIFGTASVLTNTGRAIIADRTKHTPGTYVTCGPRWIAIGKNATGAARTASCTDTALSCEAVTTEIRVAGTETSQTTTVTNDTYRSVGTLTASSASSSGAQAIDEAAQFLASSSGGGGMFTSHTFPVINLFPADTLQLTVNTQVS